MKVHENHGLIPNQIGKKQELNHQVGKPFQAMIDEATLGKTVHGGEKGLQASCVLPEGVLIIEKPGRAQACGMSPEKEGVLKEIEKTLDIVDFYAAKLADQSFPVHNLDPLVSHLEERLGRLRTLGSAPGTDEKLQGIVSETIVTIGKEAAKFRRGDYT